MGVVGMTSYESVKLIFFIFIFKIHFDGSTTPQVVSLALNYVLQCGSTTTTTTTTTATTTTTSITSTFTTTTRQTFLRIDICSIGSFGTLQSNKKKL